MKKLFGNKWLVSVSTLVSVVALSGAGHKWC